MPQHILDETEKTYGRWRVISFDRVERKQAYWRCACTCGTIRSVPGRSLRSGESQSCGCLCAEINAAACSARLTTHGQTSGGYTPEYRAWLSMRNRCKNKNNNRYQRYGGRGITVCSEWDKSFPAFFAYVGKRPSNLHSIDRWPDKDGDYKPGNVRWATREEQACNRSNNRFLEFRGQTKALTEWSRVLGIKYGTLQRRFKLGWSVDQALGAPIRVWGK